MSKSKETIRIYTDGSQSWKTLDGGWAFVAKCGDITRERSGSASKTTNNCMELTAIKEAMLFINKGTRPVELYVDSEYAINAITVWFKAWERNDWINSQGKPVMNQDLIREIRKLYDDHREDRSVQFIWLRGHNGHPENERADLLAGEARKELTAGR